MVYYLQGEEGVDDGEDTISEVLGIVEIRLSYEFGVGSDEICVVMTRSVF